MFQAVVSIDGLSPLEFSEVVDDNLFLVVYHRNHLAVMSDQNLELTEGIITFDFSTALSKVFGGQTGYKQLEINLWAMASGDGNNDGIVNSGDKLSVWHIKAGSSGYFNGDYNLDCQVNNADKNDVWLINFGMESQVPE